MLLLLGSLAFTNVSAEFSIATDVASRVCGVDRELCYAVAWQESRFDVRAWSKRPDGTYDRGAYQLSPSAAQDAARDLGWPEVELAIARNPKILYSPWLNAWLAIRYLAMMHVYLGDPWKAVEAYHVGLRGYRRGERQLDYVAGVREAYRKFKGGQR